LVVRAGIEVRAALRKPAPKAVVENYQKNWRMLSVMIASHTS
jgi:hypothetical protein